MRIPEVDSYCLGYFILADLDDVVCTFGVDLKRFPHGDADRYAVRKGRCGLRLYQAAGFERQLHGQRLRRDDTDDFRVQPQRVSRRDNAANSRAAADRHIHRVEVGCRGKQLERITCDAANKFRVKGRRHVKILFFREAFSLNTRVVVIIDVFDDSSSRASHRGVFLRRIRARDQYLDWQPGGCSGFRLTLAVVAACGRDDSLNIGVSALQPIDKSDAATNLERSGRCMIFMLYPDCCLYQFA